jgi:alpha-aminoadipate/glutamate carrier protein LysW
MSVTFACPECGAEIDLTGPELGELVMCDECAAELEVTGLEPATLSAAPQEDEDWGE